MFIFWIFFATFLNCHKYRLYKLLNWFGILIKFNSEFYTMFYKNKNEISDGKSYEETEINGTKYFILKYRNNLQNHKLKKRYRRLILLQKYPG